MSFRITAEIRRQMLAQAEAAYPQECCGLVIGRPPGDGRVDGEGRYYLPCTNVHGGERGRRFLIDPQAYLAAEDRADGEGLAIVSIVHSHPDHPDRPSAFDRQHAWPGLSYVIIAVKGGRVRGCRSWRLRDDRSRFDNEPLLCEGDTP